MTTPEPPIDLAVAARAAVEVLVFAPLGLGAMMIEDGPAAVRRVRRELANARFIGRFAVDRGVADLRRSLVPASPGSNTDDSLARAHDDAPAPDSDASAVDVAAPAVSSGDVAPDATVSDGSTNAIPAVGGLALPDYDTLPAIDIVAKLDALTTGQRDAIGRYESAHRMRRTVLGKVAQLAQA